jgi:hypothetical protein
LKGKETLITTSTSTYLDLPIVIPRVCRNPRARAVIGKPFHRAYAPVLSEFGISEEQFLTFIDELNLAKMGHPKVFGSMMTIGSVVHAAGYFDPTGITSLTGRSIHLAGKLAALSSASGPMSRKSMFLKEMNETLFNPKGLSVSLISSKKLRPFLGLAPDRALTASLHPDFAVPTETELLTGKRSIVTVMQRQMLALGGKVSPIQACPSLQVRAEDIANSTERMIWAHQVGSEIIMMKARRKALLKMGELAQMTDEKKKNSVMKAVRNADLEVKATERLFWLVVMNLSDVVKVDDEAEEETED